MTLEFRNMTASANGTILVNDVSVAVGPGQLLAIIGPNGSGKTSLLRAGLGLINGAAGTLCVDGATWQDIPPMDRARCIAYVPQQRELAWPLRVEDIVALGRFAYGVPSSTLRGESKKAVERALESCGLSHLRKRSADTLSGGEVARMHCARAFAAETPFLLADEPAASLDPFHQHQIMALFRQYVDEGGGAAIVLHDLALAHRYADTIAVLKNGKLVATGPIKSILTAALIEDTFDVPAAVDDDGVRLLPPIAAGPQIPSATS